MSKIAPTYVTIQMKCLQIAPGNPGSESLSLGRRQGCGSRISIDDASFRKGGLLWSNSGV